MGNYIKKIVDCLIKKYKTNDPFELASLMGIEVQIGSPGCAGCYMFLKNHRYIFLNQDLNDQELPVVMAHELGHAIMHRKQNCYFIKNKTLLLNSKTEREANIFAAELLIDDDIIMEHQEYTSSQLSRLLGYSEKLVELRLENYVATHEGMGSINRDFTSE